MDDDQPVLHPSSDPSASSATNEEMATGHFCTSIVSASVKKRDASACHSIACKITSHAFANDGGAAVGGAEKAPSIALKRERATVTEGSDPGAQDPECPEACTFGESGAQAEFAVLRDGVASIGPADAEDGVLFGGRQETGSKFLVDVQRALDHVGNIRHTTGSCLPHK